MTRETAHRQARAVAEEWANHVKEIQWRAIAWASVALLGELAIIVGLAVDVLARWGQPLIVEVTSASIIWLVGFMVYIPARLVAKKYIDHDKRHERFGKG